MTKNIWRLIRLIRNGHFFNNMPINKTERRNPVDTRAHSLLGRKGCCKLYCFILYFKAIDTTMYKEKV